MSKVIFTEGIPGSGKTTWAKAFCEKNPQYVRISRDDLRTMRGKYWIPKDEDMISAFEEGLIITALEHGKNVVVDATNLNQKSVNRLKEICLLVTHDIEFQFKSFKDVPLEDCIKRDLARPNSIGEKTIREFYNKYLNTIKPIVQNPNLPRAIICDLDGTLCIHNGRSPYEYQKCDTDLVNEKVKDILQNFMESNQILFVSGRDDSCKEKTVEWLKRWSGVNAFSLYMRKTGDKRKDDIVKLELFEEHIKDKYCVDFVLDDRDRVVRMWRDLGLTCLQVNYGDF